MERNRVEVEERQKEKTKVEVRARAAMEAAKERGLELPPVVEGMIGGVSGESTILRAKAILIPKWMRAKLERDCSMDGSREPLH